MSTCPRCGGCGEVTVHDRLGYAMWWVCPECKGEGEVPTVERPRPVRGGSVDPPSVPEDPWVVPGRPTEMPF